MKKLILLFAVLIVLASFKLTQQDNFKPLQGLAGTWTMKTQRGLTCERWRKVSDTEMAGEGFRIRGTDTAITERFKLVKKGNDIVYQALVSDQNNGEVTEFKLTSTQNGVYVFSNSQHDFPQEVVYQLPTADSLHAWINGKINGQLKRVDFKYARNK